MKSQQGSVPAQKLAQWEKAWLTLVYHDEVLGHAMPMLHDIWFIAALYWGVCALLIFVASRILP
jgi:hypothetical protein